MKPALVRAVEAAGMSPCEKFNCPHVAECAARRLACGAFARFVWDGKTVRPEGPPTRAQYKKIFEEQEAPGLAERFRERGRRKPAPIPGFKQIEMGV